MHNWCVNKHPTLQKKNSAFITKWMCLKKILNVSISEGKLQQAACLEGLPGPPWAPGLVWWSGRPLPPSKRPPCLEAPSNFPHNCGEVPVQKKMHLIPEKLGVCSTKSPPLTNLRGWYKLACFMNKKRGLEGGSMKSLINIWPQAWSKRSPNHNHQKFCQKNDIHDP